MASEANDVFEQVKAEYMERIYEEIRADAVRRAGPGGMRAVDAFRAFEDYFGKLPQRRHSSTQFLQDISS